MKTPPSLADAVNGLAGTFSGTFLQPHDPGYDDTRRVHNGLVDKHPALIARCRGVADVVDAVNLARELDLEVAIRGGGHNVAGRATLDAGLMIDLSLMRGIHVDPYSRTVRVEGGVTWGEFNRETQHHGLATTGGAVSSTGVAGLTLGGGVGWLMGKYGLSVDNLLSGDMVTAEGRMRRVDRDHDPDLFWAVRGAGSNFGVVTSLQFRLHPVGPLLTGGLIVYPLESAGEVLRFYRDFTATAPDELVAFAGLIHAPDGSGEKMVGIVCSHCGSLEDGEVATRAVREFGSPLMNTIGPLTYCQLNTMMDGGFPRGALNYWKANFLNHLSDAAIDAIIDCFSRCPTPMCQILIEHIHGAVARVDVADTSFPHRAEGYDLLVLSQWQDPADTERCIAWARESMTTMATHLAPGRYVNYMDHDESGDPVAAAYGTNFARLRELKTRYDPDNFFHMNQNIRPAS